MDDTKGSSEEEYKGLPQISPFLYEIPPPMACKMLIDDQLPCILRPHEYTYRSCTAPPDGSPDIWMDDTKGSTEEEYKGFPQTLPFLYEIPPPTACKMLIDDVAAAVIHFLCVLPFPHLLLTRLSLPTVQVLVIMQRFPIVILMCI